MGKTIPIRRRMGLGRNSGGEGRCPEAAAAGIWRVYATTPSWPSLLSGRGGAGLSRVP